MDTVMLKQLLTQALSVYPELQLKITKARNSKYGDFRYYYTNKRCVVTLNHNLSPFFTYVVFLHELAHYHTHIQYPNKKSVSPHGKEWVHNYRELLAHELLKKAHQYTQEELVNLKTLWRNPKYKFPHHIMLGISLSGVLLSTVADNQIFTCNGKGPFIKIEKKRIKFLCKSLDTQLNYLIHQDAEVEVVGVYPILNP